MYQIRRFPGTLVRACRTISVVESAPAGRQLPQIAPACVSASSRRRFPSARFSGKSSWDIETGLEERWYDSHDDSTKGFDQSGIAGSTSTSRWKHFKDIPVHPTILASIEAVGVGIQPRKTRSRSKSKSKSRDTRVRLRRGRARDVLDEAGEKDFFRGQKGQSRLKNVGKDESSGEGERKLGSPPMWLPPPPFASNSFSKDGETTGLGHIIKRLPVKLLGSAGSLAEEFPRSSKGLAEVALAGRSNVGKSTLLNALLYGNQAGSDGGPIQRRVGRRQNPQLAQMPKGAKAEVSSKPGETKRITLYQLSSELSSTNNEEPLESGDKERKQSRKAKMSLILADLPGYGFAFTSEAKAAKWKELMQHYLLNRGKSLKRVLLLVDSRHGLKSADFEFLDNLQDAVKAVEDQAKLQQKKGGKAGGRQMARRQKLPPIQIVLTKCDLVKQQDLARRVVQVKQELSDAFRREPSSLPVMLVSAKAGVGFNNVRQERARGGVLELQKEVAALVPLPKL